MNIIQRIYMWRLKTKNPIKYYRKLGAKIGTGNSFYNVNIDYGHAFLVSIGDNNTLTNCSILTHDASTYKLLGKSRVADVIIGNNCFVGKGSIILPGVHVGDNVIVAAGSVVSSNIPADVVIAGNPARIIKSRKDFDEKYKSMFDNSMVWETHWSVKNRAEKEEMFLQLRDRIGFDA